MVLAGGGGSVDTTHGTGGGGVMGAPAAAVPRALRSACPGNRDGIGDGDDDGRAQGVVGGMGGGGGGDEGVRKHLSSVASNAALRSRCRLPQPRVCVRTTRTETQGPNLAW